MSVRAKRGAARPGANPTDRGKPGSKDHLLVDRCGVPLAVGLSAANTHDPLLLEPMVDAVSEVKGPRGRPGRPHRRPAKLHGDKGDDDVLLGFCSLACALTCPEQPTQEKE